MRTRAVLAVLIWLAILAAAVHLARRPRLYDPLDARLGMAAWQPEELLRVLEWKYLDGGPNPYGLAKDEFYDTQHQALLRLLDLQQAHFGRAAPPHAMGGTGASGQFAQAEGRIRGNLIVVGTGSRVPDSRDEGVRNPCFYWGMERFVFAPTGELISREAYTQR